MQFTHEIEKDHTLPFLDVKLIRKEQHVDTTVYRKPTTLNVYLHWHSVSPKTKEGQYLKVNDSKSIRNMFNDKYVTVIT